jgi:dethiobiotin synthetase
MGVLFVTGSGTEVGKTYVTALLTQQSRASGRAVRALKPVASGLVPVGDPEFDGTDPARLLAAQGLVVSAANVADCTPWRFAAPLAPDMAAAAEGRSLTLEALVRWIGDAVAKTPEPVLVEGVGGVMSPIASDALNIDLIAALRCPAILVCGSYLGAISHALTAIAALRERGIELRCLVLNETAGSSVDFDATRTSLSRFAPDVRIATLRWGRRTIEGLARGEIG